MAEVIKGHVCGEILFRVLVQIRNFSPGFLLFFCSSSYYLFVNKHCNGTVVARLHDKMYWILVDLWAFGPHFFSLSLPGFHFPMSFQCDRCLDDYVWRFLAGLRGLPDMGAFYCLETS